MDSSDPWDRQLRARVKEFDLKINHTGSAASQRAGWPYMPVSPEEPSQADLSLPVIAVGMQIHLFVFDCGHSRSIRMLSLQRFLPDQLILISSACSFDTKSLEVNWQP